MRPTQFVTKCVTDWKCEIKLAHVLEVRQRIAMAIFSRQSRWQRLQRLLAAFGFAPSLLLVLDDQLADGPICNLSLFNRPMSALVGADAAKASRLLQVRDVLLNRAARDAKRGDHSCLRKLRLVS